MSIVIEDSLTKMVTISVPLYEERLRRQRAKLRKLASTPRKKSAGRISKKPITRVSKKKKCTGTVQVKPYKRKCPTKK